MPRLSKRKQQLAKIAPLVLESIKRRKIISQLDREKAFQIRQRQEDNFWNEYESDLEGYSSSDESGSDGEEKEEEEEEEEDTQEKMDPEDNNTGEESEEKGEEKEESEKGNKDGKGKGKQKNASTRMAVFAVPNSKSGNHLRAIRGTGSLSTEKRKRQAKRELQKSALDTPSIAMMFARQKHCGSGKNISKDQIMTFLPFEETKEEIRTRAAHDLSELLCLKTKQVKTYRTALIPQSNLYMRHQMVQSFL